MTVLRTTVPSEKTAQWWRDSIIYQLYVKSFADSDGDGVGDLDGVTAGLDHIARLGVDGIWLNPCYPSPNRDGGYDVADYTRIDGRYGGMPAFERLLAATHDRGLKLLMDLVPNHCSDQHEWFQQALVAAPGSPERDRFIFRDGRGVDGAEPPNNWRSTFGGSAWTRINDDPGDAQWYLHSFDSSQPDFNWQNEQVGQMFDDVLRTWFDRGIDGFRIDVAYAMVKHAELPDLADPAGDNPYLWNQPGVHEIFKRWRKISDSYGRDLTLLGEVWLPPADATDYIRAGELNQVFYFDLLQQPFEAGAFRLSIAETLAGLKGVDGVPTWTLNSHDVHRSVTRYGLVEAEPMNSPDVNALRTRARGPVDVELGTHRAIAATLLVLALPGSVYLYQGEELGLPEVQDLPEDTRQDPIWARSEHAEYGRDGCRVPMPWSASGRSFGFSADDAVSAPWLPQPAWFADFAADRQQDDPDSVLAFYRRALHARQQLDQAADLEWLETGREDVLAFRRGAISCVTVFDGCSFMPPAEWGALVCSSLPAVDAAERWLAAGSTGWYAV
ncbi:MAG: alpha-glucosidase [Pseudonocardiales bacterium]|jgi:alpha-glucosidase|nr:alpha-glucosidase [Pseudonocardiales bacterium]